MGFVVYYTLRIPELLLALTPELLDTRIPTTVVAIKVITNRVFLIVILMIVFRGIERAGLY